LSDRPGSQAGMSRFLETMLAPASNNPVSTGHPIEA
jgi:hypothetical protein